LEIFFIAFFVRFSTRGVKKTPLKTFWGNPCQKPLAEKVEKGGSVGFVFGGPSQTRMNNPAYTRIKSVNADSPINKVKSDKIRKCRLPLFFSF
jgi:hypothetical protein